MTISAVQIRRGYKNNSARKLLYFMGYFASLVLKGIFTNLIIVKLKQKITSKVLKRNVATKLQERFHLKKRLWRI